MVGLASYFRDREPSGKIEVGKTFGWHLMVLASGVKPPAYRDRLLLADGVFVSPGSPTHGSNRNREILLGKSPT